MDAACHVEAPGGRPQGWAAPPTPHQTRDRRTSGGEGTERPKSRKPPHGKHSQRPGRGPERSTARPPGDRATVTARRPATRVPRWKDSSGLGCGSKSRARGPLEAAASRQRQPTVPFPRCCLRSELMSEDLPTLGTPITMMQYSAFCRGRGQGLGTAAPPGPPPGARHGAPTARLRGWRPRCSGPRPAGGRAALPGRRAPRTHLASVVAVAAPNQLSDHGDDLQHTSTRACVCGKHSHLTSGVHIERPVSALRA